MSHLDTMSSDELLGFSIKQAKQVYRYKGRFSEVYVYLSTLSIYLYLFIYLFFLELMESYKSLQKDKEKLELTLQQSQDKSLRRISELKEVRS